MDGYAVLALQTALYQKLTGDATLMALIEDVHDHVPEDAHFPYIALSEPDSSDASFLGLQGMETVFPLLIISRARGRKEALTIAARVYALLHDGSMTVSGQTLVQSRFVRQQTNLLGDGVTRRIEMQFALRTEAA